MYREVPADWQSSIICYCYASLLSRVQTLCDPVTADPPGNFCRDSPGKNKWGEVAISTNMKVKSESQEIIDHVGAPRDPMDCSLQTILSWDYLTSTGVGCHSFHLYNAEDCRL